MNDPKAIPDDILIAAEQAFEAILSEAYKGEGFCGHYRLIGSKAREIIAKAILGERSASLRDGFLLGFKASAEGYNGEYPFEGYDPEAEPRWRLMRERKIEDFLAQATPSKPTHPEVET